ncbi:MULTISPECIES: single-stranded DNA-binding protein [Paeniglutamicibacter]|uniref:Single-stranded DNA-binding protein n=1 Tax=Paeniglutamicibacter sulfureus TaxID=43666 RepID=A0ABU2BDR5_9MICC|nr:MULTISPECIES: single-stranded DNA-binding protein [Paeniglutamicibacter]MCV9993782.1 single-stranded DNA-binding protein [Paeniglutamicibacter sp. ZC-3]MDO2936568.1 single-stranded DNA-binding protein [Paeniglutamicibacter sulfureus]MDR7356782.1 single-strand DNA-binding protein [Paeniglutamicibacter sulfureus]
MTDHITLRGVVGTEPRPSGGSSGTLIAKFRLVSNERRQDPETGQWNDVHSNWYTVSCFRAMATNMLASIHMGDHVVVYGKMQVREYDRQDGTRGFSVDIDAMALGHDLRFGVSRFERVRRAGGDDNTEQHLRHGKAEREPEESNSEFPVTGWPDSGQGADTEAA